MPITRLSVGTTTTEASDSSNARPFYGYMHALLALVFGLILCLGMSGCFGATAGIAAWLAEEDDDEPPPPAPRIQGVVKDYAPYTGRTTITITGKNLIRPGEVTLVGVTDGRTPPTPLEGSTSKEWTIEVPQNINPVPPAGEKQVILKTYNAYGKQDFWLFSYETGSIKSINPAYGIAVPGGDPNNVDRSARTVSKLNTRLFQLSQLAQLSGDFGIYLVPQAAVTASDEYPFDVDWTAGGIVKLEARDLVVDPDGEESMEDERYTITIPPDPRRTGQVSGQPVYSPYNLVLWSPNGRARTPFSFVPPFPPEDVLPTVQMEPADAPSEEQKPVVIVTWRENADGPPSESIVENAAKWPPDTDLLAGDLYAKVQITRRPHDPTQIAQTFEDTSNGASYRFFRDTALTDYGVFTYDVVGFWLEPTSPPGFPGHPTIPSSGKVAVYPPAPFHLVWDPSEPDLPPLQSPGGGLQRSNSSGAALTKALREAGQLVFFFTGDELSELDELFGALPPLGGRPLLLTIWVMGANTISEEILTEENAEILLNVARSTEYGPDGATYGVGIYLETREYLFPATLADADLNQPARELLTTYFGISSEQWDPSRKKVQVEEAVGTGPLALRLEETPLLEPLHFLPDVATNRELERELKKKDSTVAREILLGRGEAPDSDVVQEILTGFVHRTGPGGGLTPRNLITAAANGAPGGVITPKNFIISSIDFKRYPEDVRSTLAAYLASLLQGEWSIPLPGAEPKQPRIDLAAITPTVAPFQQGALVTIPGTDMDLVSEVVVWNQSLTGEATPEGDMLAVRLPPCQTLGEVLVRVYGQGGVIVGEFPFTYRAARDIDVSPKSIPVNGEPSVEVRLTITGKDLDLLDPAQLQPVGGGDPIPLVLEGTPPFGAQRVEAGVTIDPAPTAITTYDLLYGFGCDEEQLTFPRALTLYPPPAQIELHPAHAVCGKVTNLTITGENLWEGIAVYFCTQGGSCVELQGRKLVDNRIEGVLPVLENGQTNTIRIEDPWKRPDGGLIIEYACRDLNADFIAVQNTDCRPFTVEFLDRSGGVVDFYDWDFGDGSPPSSLQNPVHTYMAPGVYSVTLTVVGPEGTDVKLREDYITVQEKPTADFVSDAVTGCAPLTVGFTDQSGGTVEEWTWDFGEADGEDDEDPSASLQNPTHTYETPGTYTVTLTATGPCGTDTTTKKDLITVWDPFVADFSAQPATPDPCAPLTLTFADLSTPVGHIDSWEWDFGDETTSTDQNPIHTYAAPGNYPVTLTVTGPCGTLTETKMDFVVIPIPPVANFTTTPSDAKRCAPLTVEFTDVSTGTITSWEWDFGDNSTSTEQAPPAHTYQDPGTYTASLKIKGPCGVDTKEIDVEVRGTPSAAFAGDILNDCAPFAVKFTDYSTGTVDSWSWSFGDSGASTQQNPTYVYTKPGNYTVTLTVTGPCGTSTDTKTNYVTVNGAPTAAFTVAPATGCAPLRMNFTDLSTGAIDTWTWEFGDVSLPSSEQNPPHVYQNPGTYTVTLKVVGPCGNDSTSQTVTVNGPPTPTFSGSPLTGCAPLTVSFIDTSTGSINGWSWDFSDGSPSTAKNPTHTYATPGQYTVVLTATGLCGSATTTKTNYVTVLPPIAASFSADVRKGCAPLTVAFSDASTGGVNAWQWFFGDNGSSSDQNPTYVYETPGTYDVILTATGDCGGTSGSDTVTMKDFITVYAPPVADFTGGPTTICEGASVQFQDLSSGDVTGWLWDFGDEGASSDRNPTHTYADPGTYNVKLTVSGKGDCQENTKTESAFVTVNSPHVAAFSATPTGGCPPLEVTFTDESTGTITGWKWFFPDSSTSTKQNPPKLTLNTPGTHTVKLEVKGPCGTVDRAYQDIVVAYPPKADFKVLGAPDDAPLIVVGDQPQPVPFTNLSTGDGPMSWLWDFGDDAPGAPESTEENPTHVYTKCGTFTVKLTATSACGSNTKTRTNYLQVGEGIFADFTMQPTPTEICVGSTVTFNTSNASGEITSWHWTFGDGETASGTGAPPVETTHQYNIIPSPSPEVYPVTFTVNGPCGTHTATDNVTVWDKLIPDFSVDPVRVCVGTTVTFTDQSSGPISSWTWVFEKEDGTKESFSGRTPEPRSYSKAREYYVTLTVDGGSACGPDSITKTITVDDPLEPSIEWNPDPENMLNILFQGTEATGGTVQSWEWDFGDTNVAVGQDVSHVYSACSAGYTVRLAVTGVCGTVSTTEIVPVGTQLVPDFTVHPDTPSAIGCAPLKVKFQGTSLPVEPESDVDWHWHFGYDGATATGPTPTWPFPVGEWDVTLTVTGPCGDSEPVTKQKFVVVYEPIVADFQADATQVCVGDTVQFTNLTTGPADTWQWEFGDGVTPDIHTSTEKNPQIALELGDWTVSLTASGPYGCQDVKIKYPAEDEHYIRVSSLLEATITYQVLNCEDPPTGPLYEFDPGVTPLTPGLSYNWQFLKYESGTGWVQELDRQEEKPQVYFPEKGVCRLVRLTVEGECGPAFDEEGICVCGRHDTGSIYDDCFLLSMDVYMPSVFECKTFDFTATLGCFSQSCDLNALGNVLDYTWTVWKDVPADQPPYAGTEKEVSLYTKDAEHTFTNPGTYYVTLVANTTRCGPLYGDYDGAHYVMIEVPTTCEELPVKSAADSPGHSTIITFNKLPGGTVPPPDSPIGDRYAAWGVVFSSVAPAEPPVFRKGKATQGSYAYAAGNGASPHVSNIIAHLEEPCSRVTAEVGSGGSHEARSITMIGRDSLGTVVAKATRKAQNGFWIGPMEITSETPIVTVEWWPNEVDSPVALDNLRIFPFYSVRENQPETPRRIVDGEAAAATPR